jgi:isopenicillin N synthase-like dioxygenase
MTNSPPRPKTIGIPIADMTMLDSKKNDSGSAREFLATWDHAFRTVGFVCLVNQGLEERYRLLHDELQHFFELPLEENLKFRVAADYGYGGYTPQGQESVSRTYLEDGAVRPPDAVESLATTKGNLDTFPCLENGYHSDEVKNLSLQLKAGLDALTLKVMEIMARCLELPPDYFLGYYQDGRANNDLRVARYLPVTKEQEGKQMRYGEHTDYTGFTFLWRNADNGLQCLNTAQRNSPGSPDDSGHDTRIDWPSDGNKWINIPVLGEHQDALIVNAGDLIQRWTNDYWISNVHRVVGSASDDDTGLRQGKDPISIVFFTGPRDDTRISVLSQSPKVSARGDINDDYKEEITAGEHLWRKVNASNK